MAYRAARKMIQGYVGDLGAEMANKYLEVADLAREEKMAQKANLEPLEILKEYISKGVLVNHKNFDYMRYYKGLLRQYYTGIITFSDMHNNLFDYLEGAGRLGKMLPNLQEVSCRYRHFISKAVQPFAKTRFTDRSKGRDTVEVDINLISSGRRAVDMVVSLFEGGLGDVKFRVTCKRAGINGVAEDIGRTLRGITREELVLVRKGFARVLSLKCTNVEARYSNFGYILVLPYSDKDVETRGFDLGLRLKINLNESALVGARVKVHEFMQDLSVVLDEMLGLSELEAGSYYVELLNGDLKELSSEIARQVDSFMFNNIDPTDMVDLRAERMAKLGRILDNNEKNLRTGKVYNIAYKKD